MKLVIAEPGTDVAARLWHAAEDVATLRVAELEARAAIARQAVRIDAAGARRRLAKIWAGVDSIPVDDRLLKRAKSIVDEHRLRALDALHLAAALRVGVRGSAFVSWDREQLRAAVSLGMSVVRARV